jgi:hypothetical protein
MVSTCKQSEEHHPVELTAHEVTVHAIMRLAHDVGKPCLRRRWKASKNRKRRSPVINP